MSRIKAKRKSGAVLRKTSSYPVRAIAIGLAAVVMLGSGWLLWANGWPQRQAERAGNAVLALTAQAGFSLEQVNITGRQHIDRDALLETLQVERGMPILALDKTDMIARLQTIPWLADATIERQLPNTLLVRLTEREPLALWQFRNQITVIDRQGAVIHAVPASDFATLPLVVGAGAAEEAATLLQNLQDYPQIRQVLRAATRIGERRWDLLLEPGVTVRLPDENETIGLRRLATLLHDPQILNREVQTVDLRFPDRMVLERSPGSTPATKTASGNRKT